jgi:CRP-like cAMP-binding protein
MKTILPLRLVAMASNMAFVAYGFGAGLMPILLLHSALLPLNTVRTVQHLRHLADIRKSAREDADLKSLLPLMKRQAYPAGTVLFRKGDLSEKIYLLVQGHVRITEIDKRLNAGALIGEVGLFAPDRRRSGSVVCETDCEIGSIGYEGMMRLVDREPGFGLHLARVIARRMHQDRERVLLAQPSPEQRVNPEA